MGSALQQSRGSTQQTADQNFLESRLLQAFDQLAEPRSSWRQLIRSESRSKQQTDMAIKTLAKQISVQAGELVDDRKNRSAVRAQIYQQIAPFLKELSQREGHILDRSRRWFLSGTLTGLLGLTLFVLSFIFGSG